MIEGAASSTTMTLNVDVAILPEESVTEHRTLVVPTAKSVPERGEQVVVSGPSTASTAEGEVNVTYAPRDEVAEAVISEFGVITGAASSITMTANEEVAVLPEESVTEQFTVVVPIAKSVFERGEQVGVSVPSTTSVAEGEV